MVITKLRFAECISVILTRRNIFSPDNDQERTEYYLDDFFHHPDITNHPAYSLVKFLVTQWQNGNTLQNKQGTSSRQGGLGGIIAALRGFSSRQAPLGTLSALASSPVGVNNTSSFYIKVTCMNNSTVNLFYDLI